MGNDQFSLGLRKHGSTLSAGSEVNFEQNEENIGLYMKSGFCYSDVKCFVAQVLAMALVSIWFSDKKTNILNKQIKKKRKALVKSIEDVTSRIRMTMEDDYIELYQ